jgi:hypothetical protein
MDDPPWVIPDEVNVRDENFMSQASRRRERIVGGVGMRKGRAVRPERVIFRGRKRTSRGAITVIRSDRRCSMLRKMNRRGARKLSRRGVAVLVAAVIAASVTLTSAYASSSTGPRGGQGGGGVSGYVVSGIHFELGTGSSVSGIRFQLSPPTASSVRIQLTSSGPWLECTVRAGAAACSVPGGTPAAAVDSLSVVAV